MYSALAPLALRPQSRKLDLELVYICQTALIELSEARAAIIAHCAFALIFLGERSLAPQTGLRLFGEFHEAADGRRGDGDDACVVAGDCDVGKLPLSAKEKRGREAIRRL